MCVLLTDLSAFISVRDNNRVSPVRVPMNTTSAPCFLQPQQKQEDSQYFLLK